MINKLIDIIYHGHVFDPGPLIKSAKKQHPELEWLPGALEKCTECWENGNNTFFIRPFLFSRSKFLSNVMLEDTSYGDIALDILEDHTVAGFEWLSLL